MFDFFYFFVSVICVHEFDQKDFSDVNKPSTFLKGNFV